MQGADMALLDDDNAIKAITANRSAHYEPMGWHHWPEHPWLSYQFRRGLGRRLHLPWRNLVHRLAARGLSPSKFSLFGEDRLTDAQSESVRRALGASNLLGLIETGRIVHHGTAAELQADPSSLQRYLGVD